MGKQVRIKGYQSVFGSQIYIDGDTFLPEDNNFLKNFKIPGFLSVSNTIKFSGYISYRLIHLLGPGFYLSRDIEFKEIEKLGSHNPLIYVEFQVSSILYFEVKSYFFNALNYFDIAVDITYVEVQLLKENKTDSRYGKRVEININHGCGVFISPIELKEHQIRIRNEFREFQSIESVVRLDLSKTLEGQYRDEHNPDRIICFLNSKEKIGNSYEKSFNLKNIIKLISDVRNVHSVIKVYLTDKAEIVKTINKGKLINPEKLDTEGIIMLIREDRTYNKEIGDYTYSYRVESESETISLLLQWKEKLG